MSVADVSVSAIAFVLFGIVPFVSALTMERWFWRLPFIKNLEARKREWDAEKVWRPQDELTLKEYRMQQDMGPKITVTHHLADVASDIKHKLIQAQLRAFIFTAVGVLFMFTASTPVSGAAGTASITQAPSFSEVLFAMIIKVLATYMTAFSAIVLIVEGYTLIVCIIDQCRKYERLIDPRRFASRGTG